jgi:hypothetical protein
MNLENLMTSNPKRDRPTPLTTEPLNPIVHIISDWTDDPSQVDRQYFQACEKRDYYHLSHHSIDSSIRDPECFRTAA